MPIYQATAFFELLGHGWSESYFREAGSQTDLAALADFDRDNLWMKRALCLGKEAKIFAQRVSFSDVLGDSVLNYIPLAGNPAFECEDPFTALLLRFGDSVNTKFKNTFLRGICDDTVVEGGVITTAGAKAAAFAAAADAFCNALITHLYGWMGTGVRTELPVVSYVSEAVTQRIIFTLTVPLPLPAVGNKVRVTGKQLGVGGKSVLNRAFVALSDGTITCKTFKATAAFPSAGPGGFLVTRTKVLRLIKSFRKQKVVERKTGKVSYISAGRAPARPLG